jgi:hypothetical protein
MLGKDTEPAAQGAFPLVFPQNVDLGRVCPLKHSSIPKSYPQVWMKEGDIRQNPCLLAGKAFSQHELQACKLPTLWIKTVDKKGPGIHVDVGTFL